MKATPESLRKRCDTALQSLPDAPYRTMLAALFGDLLAEVEHLAAQSAPQAQQAAREYPPLPPTLKCKPNEYCLAQHHVSLFTANQMRAYVDADRAAAQVEPVRMLTEDELHECCGGCTSNAAIKTWMRRAVADFCLVNRGRVIPADGEVRG